MLSGDFLEVKIIDFGVSNFNLEPHKTISAVSGTPRYMSPEQIGEGILSTKIDIWSFGCLILQLVTGCKPYHKIE
jgi:serine/threonine protein kinase